MHYSAFFSGAMHDMHCFTFISAKGNSGTASQVSASLPFAITATNLKIIFTAVKPEVVPGNNWPHVY